MRNLRLLLAFAYQQGPIDDFVRFVERNPWKAVSILNLLGMLALAWMLYTTVGTRLDAPLARGVTGTEITRVLPTTGEQGYNVEAFCGDALTTVTRALFAPLDSAFAASYSLDRRKDGVHETITVNTYADPARQPVATHYDPANVPQDGFVSKQALACILERTR